MNSNTDSTLNASTIIRETRSLATGLVMSFILILGMALYFASGQVTLKPPHYLPLYLLALGLVLSIVFIPFSSTRDPENVSLTKNKIFFFIFQLIQGAVGFAIGRYVFNLSLLGALAFPAGILVSLLIFLLLCCEQRRSAAWLIAAALGASGLTLALRLQGLWGGLLFGQALLQGAWLGLRLIPDRDAQLLWVRSLFFIAFLVIGRGAIQYYLLMSNYASLGVVISQPYTFIALAAGIFLPIAYYRVETESLLSIPFVFILGAIILPLSLGVFIHVRPMTAYLMGLTLSTFAVGALGWGSLRLGLFSLINLSAVCAALPLFQKANAFSRVLRLEIMAAVALFAFLLLWLGAKLKKASPE